MPEIIHLTDSPTPDVPREIAFEAFGVRVLARMATEEAFDAVKAVLPPGWEEIPSTVSAKRFTLSVDKDGRYECRRADNTVARGLSLDFAVALFEAQVRAYVALHAPDWIFVHAGVVAHNGRVLVLPGMSFAGKTTLVAALVAAGATYYSDEFAVLDETGLVHPYPKPLSIRNEKLRQVDHEVESLGGTRGDEALRIGAIVATSYRPGAKWAPRRGTPGEGVMALLSNTVAAQERPPEVMRAITRASQGVSFLQSERGEADEVAPQLLAELDGASS